MIKIDDLQVDAYDLTLQEIEAILNISTIKDFNQDKEYKTYDDLNDFTSQVLYLNELSKDPSYIVSIYGYELTDDNHYVKLYYSVRGYN